jgi:hypothetical protein
VSRRTKKHASQEARRSQAHGGNRPDEDEAASWLPVLAVCGLLVLAVFFDFGQTLDHQFINYDDNT